MENELRQIKNSKKFIELKKQSSEKIDEPPVVDGPIDVSEFLKVVMPTGVEDIVVNKCFKFFFTLNIFSMITILMSYYGLYY